LQQSFVEHSASLQQLASFSHLPSFMQAVVLHFSLLQQLCNSDEEADAARSYLQHS